MTTRPLAWDRGLTLPIKPEPSLLTSRPSSSIISQGTSLARPRIFFRTRHWSPRPCCPMGEATAGGCGSHQGPVACSWWSGEKAGGWETRDPSDPGVGKSAHLSSLDVCLWALETLPHPKEGAGLAPPTSDLSSPRRGQREEGVSGEPEEPMLRAAPQRQIFITGVERRGWSRLPLSPPPLCSVQGWSTRWAGVAFGWQGTQRPSHTRPEPTPPLGSLAQEPISLPLPRALHPEPGQLWPCGSGDPPPHNANWGAFSPLQLWRPSPCDCAPHGHADSGGRLGKGKVWAAAPAQASPAPPGHKVTDIGPFPG